MLVALSEACGRPMMDLDWTLMNRPHAFDVLWGKYMVRASASSSAKAIGETHADVRKRIREGRARNLARARRGRG